MRYGLPRHVNGANSFTCPLVLKLGVSPLDDVDLSFNCKYSRSSILGALGFIIGCYLLP